MKYLTLLLVLACGLLFSCEKDELTEPAEVHFRIKLDRLPATGLPVSFQAGTIDIQSIEFTGDRETGEDITFTSDFQSVVRADLATGNTEPVVKFDVPQGTYKKINLSLNPDDIEPDITVTGQFVPALVVPVQVEINIPGQLNLLAKTADGQSDIVLTKDRGATIEVYLNPSSWFSEITVDALQAAEHQVIGGIPSIVISKNSNTDIYFKLASAIEVSAEAVLK